MISTIARTSAYIWFDAEYTDLDPERARLLQVAVIATDPQLRRLTPSEQDFQCCVRLPEDATVSPWVREHLADLVAACRSDRAVDAARLDALLRQWLDRAVGAPPNDPDARPVLAGNSIHADRTLIRKFLPTFFQALHYRMLDVTTLKLLWQDWRGGAKFDKENPALIRQYFPGPLAALDGRPHDAYYDVHASIAELNFYRFKMLDFSEKNENEPQIDEC